MQIKYLQSKQVHDISHSKYFQEPCEKREKLVLYKQLINEGCSQKTALLAIGTSRATYFRWIKRYNLNAFALSCTIHYNLYIVVIYHFLNKGNQ
ncbi:hypothetical protein KAT08_03445 [Candidatus Babeliales bacterium]|nr:hypothetical protein [Candidatus Babeliales bacterium]